MKIFVRKSLGIILVLTVALFSKTDAQEQSMEDSLNPKQQNLIAISAQTAKGNLEALKDNLNAGLDAGLTINEIKETILHSYAYCGFPRSIRGLQTFMIVLDERKAKGIKDVPGAEASPVTTQGNKYDRGKAILEKLTGVKETGPKKGYAAFAPAMEVFLKEHLFADIFERDVLTFKDRELVTISVISSIGDAEPMLRSHLSICLNVGLTPNQLQQFVCVIKPIVGKKKSRAAEKVLNEVLAGKKKD
jgi:alkylhydroperoxidase/carboxymuconolactone decarboxylase family protein YurZ